LTFSLDHTISADLAGKDLLLDQLVFTMWTMPKRGFNVEERVGVERILRTTAIALLGTRDLASADVGLRLIARYTIINMLLTRK
jgi:hypothetical protein